MKHHLRQAPAPGTEASHWLRLLQRVFGDNVSTQPRWETPTLPVPGHASLPGRRVMVVDDNPVNVMLASELLLSFNVLSIAAADGAEAVALASELRLDVILMDLQMPVLDGVAATRQIRHQEQQHGRGRVPVVAYSAAPPPLRVLQSYGIDDVLDKPCGHNDMQRCLQRWCPHLLSPASSAARRHGH